MAQGIHNVVLTDQFYEVMSYETPQEKQDNAINGFKEAYKKLNQYSSKVKFNLCTTCKEAAKKYSIPLVDSIKKVIFLFY